MSKLTAEEYYKKMTETPVLKLIVMLGIPTTVSMLITNLYNMADTVFVGDLGDSPQAATGILFTLQAIIQAIAFMLGQGSGSIVAKYLAEKDIKKASETVSTAFFTGLGLGTVLSVTGLIFLEPFMRLLGSTDTILPYAKQYGLWVLIACPFMIGSLILNNNLRYEGKAFYAMIGLTAGAILNILGDWIFVKEVELGIFGAGMATAISQIVSFFILLYFFGKTAQSSLGIKYYTKTFGMLWNILKTGFPAFIRQGLASFSTGLLNNLTKPFGDPAIAAISIVNRFSGFMMCVGLGIGQGLQPVAAYNYSAGKYSRVKKSLLVTMILGGAFIMCIALPTTIFSENIAYFFQKEQAVVEIASPALIYAAIGVMFLPLSVPVNMLYQSIRKPVLSSAISLMRNGLMFIPTLLLTVSLWGVTGIQISQPVADVITGLVSIPFILAFLLKKTADK